MVYISPEAKERYYKDVSENAFWVSNETQNGAILVKRNASDGSLAPVRDSSGSRIERHFNSMLGEGLTVDHQIKSTSALLERMKKMGSHKADIQREEERLQSLQARRKTF
jgi:hypothetical protein